MEKMNMACATDLNNRNQHHWTLEMDFTSSKTYDQFINWLRMEFYFFQQDQGSFLTIYFPNGKVKVKRQEADAILISKISIESKCLNVGTKIKEHLSEFLDHFDNYNKCQLSILG